MNTEKIYAEVEEVISKGNVFDDIAKPVFDALDKAIEVKTPLLLSGDQGVGKTFGVKLYAYKNKYDIVSVNASNDLRIKEKAQDLLRSYLLAKQSKVRIVLIDEVEKGSSINLLTKYIEANKKTAHKTKNIFVCITNHYWEMKELVSIFGSFHHPIKAPYRNVLKKYMRKEKLNTKLPIERDLRFLQNALESKEVPISNLSENTFEAINNFCQSSFKDRDVFHTFNNLSSPLWKWVLYNMIHGTLQFRLGNFMTTVKHNSEYFFNSVRVCAEADYYQNWKMLNFAVPDYMHNAQLTHPSTLNRSINGF